MFVTTHCVDCRINAAFPPLDVGSPDGDVASGLGGVLVPLRFIKNDEVLLTTPLTGPRRADRSGILRVDCLHL